MSNGSKRAIGLGSAAALAHVSRGRPSPRRTPPAVRQRALELARTRCAGFNDQHLQEKLVEKEAFSLSRETLRRLLRASGIGSPRKRRPPAHRQRRLRSAREGQLVQLDGSPYGDRSAIFTRNDDHWSVRLVLSRPRVIEWSETRPLRP
jgi:hypothetical protein